MTTYNRLMFDKVLEDYKTDPLGHGYAAMQPQVINVTITCEAPPGFTCVVN